MKRAIAEITEADHAWAHCGCCHLRVASRAVWLGHPTFREPSICVCLDCLRSAVELLDKPAPKRRGKKRGTS